MIVCFIVQYNVTLLVMQLHHWQLGAVHNKGINKSERLKRSSTFTFISMPHLMLLLSTDFFFFFFLL